MKTLNSKDVTKKNNLKKATITESGSQRIYKYTINPRDSIIYSDTRFENIDNGSQGGTHWVCFIVKDNKPYYFTSFGGQLDEFLLNHLPKTITYHKFKIQDIYSKFCGS